MKSSADQRQKLLVETINRLTKDYGPDDFCTRKLKEILVRLTARKAYELIKSGEATTQAQLKKKLDLTWDQTGDVLAWLMLDHEVIGSHCGGGAGVFCEGAEEGGVDGCLLQRK